MVTNSSRWSSHLIGLRFHFGQMFRELMDFLFRIIIGNHFIVIDIEGEKTGIFFLQELVEFRIHRCQISEIFLVLLHRCRPILLRSKGEQCGETSFEGTSKVDRLPAHLLGRFLRHFRHLRFHLKE